MLFNICHTVRNMGSFVYTSIALISLCGGLNAASVYKDSVLKFISHEPLNRHDDKTQYRDCHHLRYSGGYNVSGVYTLHLNKSFPYQVQCDHTANNSFTVIQRRMYGNVDFRQSLFHYMNGFGYAQSDYWVGLNQIYYLTTTGNNVLTITMQTWDGYTQTVYYKWFHLRDSTNYALQIGGYSGNIPDDLSYNNGMPFATYDRPDRHGCASIVHAGWWYNYCSYALPNGVYYIGGHYTPPGTLYDGIYWKDWTGDNYSLKFFSMSLSKY